MSESGEFIGRLFRSKENIERVNMKKDENFKQMNVLNLR